MHLYFHTLFRRNHLDINTYLTWFYQAFLIRKYRVTFIILNRKNRIYNFWCYNTQVTILHYGFYMIEVDFSLCYFLSTQTYLGRLMFPVSLL